MRPGGMTLAILTVGAVVALGFGGSSVTARQFEPIFPTAEIDYTCQNVTVTVEPEWVSYDLVIRYRDTETGDDGKALIGPFNGTVTEPYGPEIIFTSVEVLANGRSLGTEYIPLRCQPETSERTRSGSSESETACGVVGTADCSRNPVPVAMATT